MELKMHKFFYIFAIILLFDFVGQIQCEVTKCCPLDFVLKIQSDYHSCELHSNHTFWEAFNVLPSVIPRHCDLGRSVIEINNGHIELNGCLDKDSNNQLVALSCSEHSMSTVHLLNKCCAIGHSYDASKGFCTRDPDSHSHFQRLFGISAVVFKNKIPDCSEEEVFVEYFSTDHDIKMTGRDLTVNDKILSSEKYCFDGLVNFNSFAPNESEHHIIVRSCRPRSICNDIPCIRRCCKTNQILVKPSQEYERCQNHPKNANLLPIFHDISFPLSNTQQRIHLKDFGVLQSWKCEKIFILNQSNPDDLSYVHRNGKLYMIDQEPFDTDAYCVENVITPNGSTEVRSFLCYDDESYPQLSKHDYYPYGLLISCIFLAITLIVYLSLPKLLNVHGKTLVCYVASILAVYVTLVVLQFNQHERFSLCYEVAFFLLFCLICAFCWQTVFSFDIWLTFGSLRSSFVMRHNQRNRRKFLLYSVYAWGFPLIWVLFTIYADKLRPLPTGWNPTISDVACFFDRHLNWKEHLFFFVLPAGLHVFINCVLFAITAIRCSRVKNDIHRMQYRFTMNLKLFTVMGISWILEIISSFSENETIELILDTYNILIGVFIFIIFVFKRKVLYELKCRFGLESKNAGTATPRSTTITHTGNINLKDMKRETSERNLHLLASSTATLQMPHTSALNPTTHAECSE